ncbi:dynein heavy chain [Verticillium alfalfae VaMs.102]|uniref:Dynein heavy chain, cytoplasmic n=1 Tax=Verticillium alfalfae (strain VaMs.102 / ATCC MYA-4576 / FGSC 10136) TaxID=526221 RepID=C9S7R6_VERA1|nr:dynein heavy chain [Verticillium alfalfae VaMs.102]EEY14801.1 dynein heavy chain [Verticillium alfalfae VaMs.102]
MEVASPQSPGANGVAAAPFPTIDPVRVVEHLVSACEIALGATREDLEASGSLLHKSRYTDTIQRCNRFATDVQTTLYIQKDIIPSSGIQNGDEESSASSNPPPPDLISLSLIFNTSQKHHSIRTPSHLRSPLFPQPFRRSVSSSVRSRSIPRFPCPLNYFLLICLGPATLNATVGEQGPSTSAFEILHSYVHHVLAPYFDANTKSQQLANGSRGRGDVDSKTGIPVTKKRWNDLELSLLHLQQNVEIPEVSLIFHHVVQGALDDAASRHSKPNLESIPAATLGDSSFLNNLQSNVNSWIKSIQVITKMTKDPSGNSAQDFKFTASQEVNFWLSMESALEGIDAQLRSDGVTLTLDILKNAKRFQATVSFVADTGLKEAVEKVQKYNQLMRDFPLDELLSATSLSKLQDAIVQIFSHLNKKLRICPYPIRRALGLVEAISADLDDVLHRLLPGIEMVNLDYQEFKGIMKACDDIFRTWDDSIKEFTNVAREVTRRRNERFIPIEGNPRFFELQARLNYVSTFRDNHEQLQLTIVNVLGSKATSGVADETTVSNGAIVMEEMGDVDAVEEVKQAWEALRNVDLLDVSAEGTQRWARAENLYNERTSRVENSIISRLRDRLGTAKNANEMFRVFSKFNALFVRPKIRGAIAEYQNQLMEHVKQAINGLHERFKQQYGHSEAHAMAQLRDLPPVSGAIIWARQIEFQLDGYMKKVEDVLGADWSLHAEGQKLENESNLFRKKLNTRPIFESWLSDVQRRQISISGYLFDIRRIRSAGGTLELLVNFDPQVITLFKETRNLMWQEYNIPHSINTVSKDAKRVYPFAVSLMESVRTFSQITRQISEMGEEAVLLFGYRNEAYALVNKGVPLRWESFVNTHELFFSGKNSSILPAGTEYGLAGRSAESKHSLFIREFAAAASLMQSKTAFLTSIHVTIEDALSQLSTCPYEPYAFQSRLETIQKAVDQLNLEQYVNLPYWVENMNQKIKEVLLGRLQHAIQSWIQAFEDDYLDDGRRKRANESNDEAKPEGPTIKRLVHELTMRNQVIYLDPPLEFARASWWLQLLQEIRKTRQTFDTQEVSRQFGHTTIDYDQVQTRVNAKYDQWQHEILMKFASRLGTRMREVHADIEKARRELEGPRLDASSTAQAVQFITIVQSCKRNVKAWAPEIDMFRQGQSTLVRQRYQFPNDWLHIEQIDNSWGSLTEILEKKAKVVQDQTDALRAKITAQDKHISDKIAEITAQWNEEKPVSGTIKPDHASATLASFETKLSELQNESEMVGKAKEALDLPANVDNSLAAVLEEVHDFQSVWSNLSTIWSSLNETKETLWTAVQPRKVRSKIDDLLKSTKEMPSRMRQYAAFEHVQSILRGYLKVNSLLSDLKSEAIRDRHWTKIYKQIRPGKRYSPVSLTLGDVWDLNLVATEVIVKDIIAQAQGEMALEEFLKQVRETWTNYALELVNYQNKCRLIRGWDDLFTKCSENLNSLQAMKHSPYYKEFEEEASSWEDKLNRVHVLFDIWIDVQRQWVYLEGVFTGNADIKHLLPIESSRFQNINSEFSTVMKKVYKQPYVLDVLGIANVQKSLERLAELLNKIQKALGEYLEKEQNGMKSTLAELLADAIAQYTPIFESESIGKPVLIEFMDAFPSQIVVLAAQAAWTTAVEQSLADGGVTLQSLFDREVQVLRHLADTVLGDLEVIQRKKCEQLITECVHQRDCVEKLMKLNATTPTHYLWLLQMRYVYTPEGDFQQRLQVKMANAKLNYGFEYLGVPDRLVRTPLTDRCFLTLTQALEQRLGGSPYGPAGTGKTESVKALGLQLGRFTLVFCCDDTFDFQAMGRIFLGICQVGAWGCFDEFNRLEERILSAVSQQIQNIQLGLKQGAEDDKSQIELVGRQLRVNANTGIFITMNPGYAGRSNLPDNLKKLFRSVAMSKPDKELIAEVMLYSQGFNQAKSLSKQTVPFFDRCSDKLSKQAHYDFGLRALKSVLVSSGGLKRARLTGGDGVDVVEAEIIVQSIRETIAPKLIKSDVEIMMTVEDVCFPGVQYVPANLVALEEAIRTLAAERQLVVNDTWMTKVIQLYQIQNIHHGVMMVGNSGTGKSAAWKILLDLCKKSKALKAYIMSSTPSILRKIVDNLRGEDSKRHWIVFDGDVDPEWVENLNSVLDDNKLLTLPNGERLNLPSNVRIMFEVETLKYATLATVSRCGMVWFSEDTVSPQMMVENYLMTLRTKPFEDLDEDNVASAQSPAKALALQNHVADLLNSHLTGEDFISSALDEARGYDHIMDFTVARVLNTLFSLLNKAVRDMIEYNAQHSDFPLEPEQVEAYVSKKLLLALVWSLTGDCPLNDRKTFGDAVAGLASFGSPPLDGASSLIDFDVSLPKAEWTQWQNQVPTIEVNTHSITQTDVVIPTLDTVRHEDVLYSWLAEHKPLLLCGPPGSGKTMTLFSALRKLPNMEVVGLNFSSATTPDLLIKTFEQHCEYKKTLNGVILSPTQIGRWLVIFCDEINLPAPDKYGTQRAISFLRQLVEHNGFWRTSDKSWVTLDRIQFVGACNPPTDAGRTPLGDRFLRHAPLIMVDYPGELSLQQIYGTFNSAVLKIIPTLRGYADQLTQAMVKFYLESQQRFTPKIQPHYVYSPRELTRWARGIYEAIRPLENLSLEGLIRIWAHEALRLFQDRLVAEDERQWTDEAVRRIATQYFPSIDEQQALGGPILFSNWLSKNYVPVDREQLRDFVKARLKTFCEEEVDVPLILFNDVLEHVLRIDRVFRQPQGHLILIGVSGSGKTTLSRFVAWMNGLKVFQIKVHGKYSAEDFDDDLRDVLRRCGCKGEKICFIMDESNVLDSGFLERMNTLLANAEVPGLFEGDDFAALMTACKEGAQRQNLHLDSQEELYKWFTQQIVKNLHVVFTMNPPEDGLGSKAATSPALFNRCVLNWFGDWSDQALFQDLEEQQRHLNVGLEKLRDTVDKNIQAIVRKDDFIASIVNFNNEEKMTKPLRVKMRNEFLSNPEFTFDKVNRASKACGPLVQWVEAQVTYSEILDRVGPLRNEVEQLEEQALQTKAEAKAVENTINALESSIATYKTEYAALISETQAIKSEMERVQFKVDRSVRLLDSLSSERVRWEEGSKSFETQISTLVGDVLVAAAFLAYSGLYDQTFRKSMMEDWLHQLHLSGVQYKQHNPVTEYLSTADERLGWQENSLPVDDLCTENAIILKRFNRYPLIIDPSGRVTEFLQKESKDRRLTVTSFLDDSFTKQLESSLRFGNPILIQDADGPDVDERRSNLIKLQGEFTVHLRQLEKRLLQALNESRGNILDDDNVIETLETLKTEAAEISAKISSTEGVMAEVDEITQQYSIIARSCSTVFAVLEQLHYLNHFYQFSLQYFLDIFHSVLRGNPNLANETDHNVRRDIIVKDLFVSAFKRTALGLLQRDRITLAMLLAQASPYPMDKGLIDVILDKRVEGKDLSTEPDARDEAFARAGHFSALKDKLGRAASTDWDTFLTEELAENFVPQIWDDNTSANDQALLSLLLVKLFRLDRFVPAAERFVTLVFGSDLFDIVEDLKETVTQVPATRPVALVSSPGFDASYKVDNLVERMRVNCTNIAMGSNEGLASADKAVTTAAQTGSWVLVKNVHLAPSWLQSLEKRMDSLNPHSDFRLFLSMESSPKIPVNLLRASRVLMYEQPAGVRANMKDSMSSLSTRSAKSPVERTRLYLLLAFLHAVVQEASGAMAPNLGWKGFWEFNDSDYECSAFIIDTWIEQAAGTRTNIAPQSIPWDMIRYLVTETYGGKIDDEGDFRQLNSLVESFLTPAAYDIGHKLVEGPDGSEEGSLVVPSGTSLPEFTAWIHKLPEREPPTYLGLPANAEKLLLVGLGRSLIGNLKKVMDTLDEGEQLMAEA